MFILDDILLAPFKGLYSVFKVIQERVEDDLYDPVKLKEDLMNLQLQFEMDQITEAEYDRLEEDILKRLSESTKKNK